MCSALLKEISRTDENDVSEQPRRNTTHLPLATSTLPCNILFSPSRQICTLLGINTGSNLPNSTQDLLKRVKAGKKIWELGGRAIFDLGEGVVAKVGSNLDHDEASAMRFLEERLPAFPAPRCLGLISIGRVSLLFMTKIPGDTLESRWPTLSMQSKAEIQQSLNIAISVLRGVERAEGQPLGSLSGRCRDTRRSDRYTESPVHDEAAFNEFLLTSPQSRVSNGYKSWIKSILRTDHCIVFTHGDLHPRNIMVVDLEDGGVSLSGILDWEASGFYPEYWEYLKALNTRSTRDESDWWTHLPSVIVGYDSEVAIDRLLEWSLV